MENIQIVQGVRVGKCECGRRVELVSAWENECGRCGRLYNGFGQALRMPDPQWSDWEIRMGLDN